MHQERTDERRTVKVSKYLSKHLTAPATPPPYLYHGTVTRYLDAIRTEGLRPMNRHDVHLSPDRETATRVGARRGRSCCRTPPPCTTTAMSSMSASTGSG